MNGSVWSILALVHEAKMPIADWRRILAGEFSHVQQYLAECKGEITGTIPCPISGQRLHVAERHGKYLAFPEEGFEGDSGQLTDLMLSDVVMWRLDRERLERGLCGILNVTAANAGEYDSGGARLIGSMGVGEARKRVYLGYAGNEGAAMSLCADVAQANQKRCCVVLPAFFARCDEYLRRCEHDMIVLDEAAAFADNGVVARRPETKRDAEDLRTGPALKLIGKCFEIADDFTWIQDRRKKKRYKLNAHGCQEALRVLIESGAGTRKTALRKRDWCEAVWRKLKPDGSWPHDCKPIQFFRARVGTKTVQLPFYKDVIHSDGHGRYWLEL